MLDCYYGVGPDTAAALLVTAGDNPERLRNEASFAALGGISLMRGIGKNIKRRRLNRGGDRRANPTLYAIVIARLRRNPSWQHHGSAGRTIAPPCRCRGDVTSAAAGPPRPSLAGPAPFPGMLTARLCPIHRAGHDPTCSTVPVLCQTVHPAAFRLRLPPQWLLHPRQLYLRANPALSYTPMGYMFLVSR
ncbi:transposase [Nocardia abscessus]|uniref:transposase n=1 Tax=Nocardia abscessus TaxID=120957 RepID=UPI003CC7D352